MMGRIKMRIKPRPAEVHPEDAASAGRVFMDQMAAAAIAIHVDFTQLQALREQQLQQALQLSEPQQREQPQLSCLHDGCDGS